MSGALRKAGVALGGVGVYAASVTAAYYYLTAGRSDKKEASDSLKDGGFSFVMNPNRVRRFEEIAEAYDSQIGRDEFVMGINLLRRALLYFNATGTVLEVGAGTGRNLPYYPSNVNRVVLTDSSDQMLLQARNKIRDMGQSTRFACLQADSAKLSFPDSCFDTVVDTFGLCSYDDPVAVLKEMARVCKPSGKILLLEHGRSKSWEGLSKYLDDNAERHARNWGCVWNRDLDAILQEAGLQLERLTTWHFGTTYSVVCRPGNVKEAVAGSLLATTSGGKCRKCCCKHK